MDNLNIKDQDGAVPSDAVACQIERLVMPAGCEKCQRQQYPLECEYFQDMVDFANARNRMFNPDWNQLQATQESLREHMEAMKELKWHNETLLVERAALHQALEELCFLKAVKDRCGKTEEYLNRQPDAWTAAFQVMNTLEA